MPRETCHEDTPYHQGDNLAELMGVNLRRNCRVTRKRPPIPKGSPSTLRSYKVRDYWYIQYYLEVNQQYLANVAELQEYLKHRILQALANFTLGIFFTIPSDCT
ncbi:hypothetical protein ACUV84_010925 [Puccinellia chinampoensis]